MKGEEEATKHTFYGRFLLLFRAAPAAYRRSRAKGQIGAVAAGLHHSHSSAGSMPRVRPTPQLTTLDILNPLSKAWDRICASSWCWSDLFLPSHDRNSILAHFLNIH